MKKKSLLFATLLFISVLSLFTISACDKDTNCYIRVRVLDETTKTPISGSNVTIGMEGGNIASQTGVTDENGFFKTYFAAPAIVSVTATLVDTANSTDNTTAYREGTGSARLKDGETTLLNIMLPEQLYYSK